MLLHSQAVFFQGIVTEV